MRSVLLMMFIAVACGGSRAAQVGAGPVPDAGSETRAPPLLDAGSPPPDAGAAPDAGPVADAGGPDAGAPDAGNPFDGGTVASITMEACPENPPLLWTRSINTADVAFNGATDESGNLYWLEYQPPWTLQNQHPPAFLTSVDSDGQDRYRVPAPVAPDDFAGGVMVSHGKVFMTSGARLAAYGAGTGALSWILDLTSTFPGGSVSGLTDAGDGKVVFAVGNTRSTAVYAIDATTSAVIWSNVSSVDTGYTILGTDGKGSVLVRANLIEISVPFERLWDYLQLDAAGHELWRERRVDAGWLLAWPSGRPWLQTMGVPIPPNGHFLGAPAGWFSAAAGGDFGFAFDNATLNPFPLGVSAIRAGKVTATGLLPQLVTFNGVSVLPFLAGNHAVFVAQEFHQQPGLCHVSTAGAAFIGHVDATSMYLCPVGSGPGDLPIDGAALLPGRLIIGHRTVLNEGCGGDQFQPFTIEAYSLPGESLSTRP